MTLPVSSPFPRSTGLSPSCLHGRRGNLIKNMGKGVILTWNQIPVLVLTSCITWGELCHPLSSIVLIYKLRRVECCRGWGVRHSIYCIEIAQCTLFKKRDPLKGFAFSFHKLLRQNLPPCMVRGKEDQHILIWSLPGGANSWASLSWGWHLQGGLVSRLAHTRNTNPCWQVHD